MGKIDIDKIKKILEEFKGAKKVFVSESTVEIDGRKISFEGKPQNENEEKEVQEMIQEIKKKLKELESK
jgi:hypothetical protein